MDDMGRSRARNLQAQVLCLMGNNVTLPYRWKLNRDTFFLGGGGGEDTERSNETQN